MFSSRVQNQKSQCHCFTKHLATFFTCPCKHLPSSKVAVATWASSTRAWVLSSFFHSSSHASQAGGTTPCMTQHDLAVPLLPRPSLRNVGYPIKLSSVDVRKPKRKVTSLLLKRLQLSSEVLAAAGGAVSKWRVIFIVETAPLCFTELCLQLQS